MESRASGQHSTKYIYGEIIADFVEEDDSVDGDYTATDRQELDWDSTHLAALKTWGEAMCRRVMRECADLKGNVIEHWVLEHDNFQERINSLGTSARSELTAFLKILGTRSTQRDTKTLDLADSLLRAYEYSEFYDLGEELKECLESPDKLVPLLEKIRRWHLLESKTLFEIMAGRLFILDYLEGLVVSNAPEKAPVVGMDNLHDLLVQFPWILGPQYQAFSEEQSIGKTLKDWEIRESGLPEEELRMRTDFLALSRDNRLAVIDIKAPGVAVTFKEMQRLEQYQVGLSPVMPDPQGILIYGGKRDVPDASWEALLAKPNLVVWTWSDLIMAARSYYSHYSSVLNGDLESLDARAKLGEMKAVQRIKREGTSYMKKGKHKEGLGDTNV